MGSSKYKIATQLDSAAQFLVYQAIREDDGKQVILKMPSNPYPSDRELNRIRTEYSILQNMELPCIVRVIGLETVENRETVILENSGGITLGKYLNTRTLSIDEFFPLATKLAKALQSLHAYGIIHKNITPSSVVVDTKTMEIKLAGFHLAAKSAREALYADPKDAFETELPYISPEQTGRINSTIDFRSDIYSLGVLFYEMLTGQPPFVSDDPMEIMHSHIARMPKPLELIRHDVPKPLSLVISKLLAKIKEDRYQGTQGLLFDIERCVQLHKGGTSAVNFVPGERDVSDQFRISDKIYGRQGELLRLEQAFQKAGKGPAEMIIIGGYSGVGKSRLVKYVQKTQAGRCSFFITGKFDQFKKNEPLSSLLAALKDLVKQLLTENKEEIATWSGKVKEALGVTGQVIADVLPDIELLVGKQPPLPDLPPVEAKNRFNETFNRFVKVFCVPGKPLCIFLDDLQWMDSATRQWIETILIDLQTDNLLLIGTYRDNEVSASHPLMLMLDRIIQSRRILETINLQPLDISALNLLIADSLNLEPAACADLTQIIFQKTNGNPFFSRQCLLSLYENGAVYFDPRISAWIYDVRLVQQAKISDNVIDLMVQLIRRLPEKVQDTLKPASCIGNRFDIDTLVLVSGKAKAEIYEELTNASDHGIIIPFNSWHKEGLEEFTFLHDRIQQSLLGLLPDEEKRSIRLHIARVLLSRTVNIETEEKIYDIANHLNYARELVSGTEEINILCNVNLSAGIRAKNSSAYEQARNYITMAMDALPPAELKKPSRLTKELFLQRADCEHLCGNNDIAEKFYNEAILLATTDLEKAEIFQRKIYYYINTGKFREAYRTGREAIKPLGVNLPAKFVPPLLVKDILRYRLLLTKYKIPEIVDLPDMTDERMKMAILLMSTFARAAYQIKPELCVALCFKIVNICLRHGNTEGANVGYLAVGPIFLGAVLGFRQTGFDIGQLTLALVEKFKSHAFKAEAYFVIGYFAVPWREPATEMERYWQIAYEAGLEVGDLFHTSCACCGMIQSYYMRGVNFDEIWKVSNRYLEFLQRINNREAVLTLQSVRQSILNLRGETRSPDSYNTESFNEDDYKKELQGFGSRHFAHYYFINKMQTLYLWGEYGKAYEMTLESDRYLKDSPGMLHTAEHYFYKALIICALYPDAKPVQKLKWKLALHRINRKFSKFAKGCPFNFLHKSQLIHAEIHRATGNLSEAENAYYSSIESAARFGYTNITALANDLIMRFHYNNGRRLLAGFHLRNSEYAYQTLGATAYARFLHSHYPELFDSYSEDRQGERKRLRPVILNEAADESTLDLATVLKSSEAISREIRLTDLLATLMKIIIENAGAQRMVLLLQQQHDMTVYAESIADTETVHVHGGIPLEQYDDLSRSMVYYVARTQTPVILDDAASGGDYASDPYILRQKPKSVLCAPLIKQGDLTGIIYIENNLTTGAFTKERIDLLNLLSGQVAISIENALLYDNLEAKVIERTEELKSKNIELEEALKTLRESQRKLLHAEKMASLGQMASGIAHEIQNPLNFVINFSALSRGLITELKELVHTEAEKDAAGITGDMAAILDDLELNTSKISSHGQRAEKIVKGLMIQTSTIGESKKNANPHDLLDDAVGRAQNSFLGKTQGFSPVVTRHYCRNFETLYCMPESLTHVFINVIDNALYSIHEKKQKLQNGYQPEILIETKRLDDKLQITIRDNGEGIPRENMDKIFIPFFTTKPTGKGNTGNGLTLCHQMITQGHKGDIEAFSEYGSYTEIRITLPGSK